MYLQIQIFTHGVITKQLGYTEFNAVYFRLNSYILIFQVIMEIQKSVLGPI